MTVESATYISDLNTSNPASGDAKSEGDDHLRLLKSTIKTTFPNVSGAVTPTHTELNYVDGVTSAIQTQLDAKLPKTGGTLTGNVDITATAGNIGYLRIASNGLVAGTTSFDLQQDGSGNADLVQRNNARLSLYTNATERLRITEDGRFYGTALHDNAGSVTGTVTQYIASGTYTPTGGAGTNIGAVTPRAGQWMRVGNVVTVSGSCSVDANTAGSASNFSLTLPIASDFTTAYQLGGTAVDTSGTRYAVSSDATNNVANFETGAAGSASAQETWFSFTYVVV